MPPGPRQHRALRKAPRDRIEARQLAASRLAGVAMDLHLYPRQAGARVSTRRTVRRNEERWGLPRTWASPRGSCMRGSVDHTRNALSNGKSEPHTGFQRETSVKSEGRMRPLPGGTCRDESHHDHPALYTSDPIRISVEPAAPPSNHGRPNVTSHDRKSPAPSSLPRVTTVSSVITHPAQVISPDTCPACWARRCIVVA